MVTTSYEQEGSVYSHYCCELLMLSLAYCRFPGLIGANNSNAYSPLPTDETRAAHNVQQSNNADADVNVDENANQSSAAVSPRSLRRRHVTRSPTRSLPALQTIPEERGEDGAVLTDDSGGNSNTNNSSSLLPAVSYTNSNANNSAGNHSLEMVLVQPQDVGYITPLPSPLPPPPPPVRDGNGAERAWRGHQRRPVTRVRLDDDGFETVDLFTANS